MCTYCNNEFTHASMYHHVYTGEMIGIDVRLYTMPNRQECFVSFGSGYVGDPLLKFHRKCFSKALYREEMRALDLLRAFPTELG